MKHRPEYDSRIIGDNLKRLRKLKGLSVNEVSEYLRISKQEVYNYENGNRYPQTDSMFALMELYEADLHDIIDEYVEAAETLNTEVIEMQAEKAKKVRGTVDWERTIYFADGELPIMSAKVTKKNDWERCVRMNTYFLHIYGSHKVG